MCDKALLMLLSMMLDELGSYLGGGKDSKVCLCSLSASLAS